MGALYQVLWLLSPILTGALIASLAIKRLAGVYRWFFVFLCFQLAQSVLLIPLDVNSERYHFAYLGTESFICVLNILVVLELYSLALAGHPGIATLSRWAMLAAIAVAVGLSAITLSADLGGPAGQFPILVYERVVERGILSSLFVFLLLITAFLGWFPLGVRRNLVLHAGVFSVYCLATGMVLFTVNVRGTEVSDTISAVVLLIVDVCLLAWLLFLNKRGEKEVVVVRRKWHPQDEERLSEQLDSLNSLLLKPPRR
jgi:hypothetical protein